MREEPVRKNCTPVQKFFLKRLGYLLSLSEQMEVLRHVPWGCKLVPLAIHSTLLDCRDLGVEEEACRVLHNQAKEFRKMGR